MTYFRPLAAVASDLRAWALDPRPRIGIGYPIMDSRTSGGAARGEVILFQARSQVGKTAFAVNVFANNKGNRTIFFSLEMHARYIAARLAAIHTGTPTSFIEDELRSTGQSKALAVTVDDYGRSLVIVDKPAMSLKEMNLAVDEIEHEWGDTARLICIDYLELIGGIPALSQLEKIDQVARKIKDFARERDAVVLLLHQVGRSAGGAGHLPLDMASGRYGGETQADYVLAAYRPCLRPDITQRDYLSERHDFRLQFLKTRGGSEIHPEGVAHYLDPETLKISEWGNHTLPMVDLLDEVEDPFEVEEWMR